MEEITFRPPRLGFEVLLYRQVRLLNPTGILNHVFAVSLSCWKWVGNAQASWTSYTLAFAVFSCVTVTVKRRQPSFSMADITPNKKCQDINYGTIYGSNYIKIFGHKIYSFTQTTIFWDYACTAVNNSIRLGKPVSLFICIICENHSTTTNLSR